MAATAMIEPGMMVVDQSLHENPKKISDSLAIRIDVAFTESILAADS